MTSSTSLRPRLADERGVTLIELLVSVPIAVVLLAVVLVMFNVAYRQTNKVNDRVEAVAGGRLAMEEVTRNLRSQVCPATTGAAILSGTGDEVSFYSDLTGGASQPEIRTFTYDPTAKTLIEKRYASTGGTWPDLTYSGYPATPTRTRRLLENTERVSGGPIFNFYAFDSNGVVSTSPLSASPTLAAADLPRVVRVKTSFVARPRTNQAPQASTFQSQVDVRTADPNNPTEAPRCL